MIELADRFHLTPEADYGRAVREPIGMQHFQCKGPVQAGVFNPIHRTKAARAQFLDKPVLPDLLGDDIVCSRVATLFGGEQFF